MIRISDSLKLASTKLRTRKVRLAVTLIVSSLLFSILFSGSLAVRGVVSSIEEFSKSGFGDRYITSAISANFGGDYTTLSDKEFIANAEALQKKINAEKKAEAAKLGLELDPSRETVLVNQGPGGGGPDKIADSSQPEVINLLNQKNSGKAEKLNDEFRAISSNYGAIATYRSIPHQLENNGSLNVLVDNKENYEYSNGQSDSGGVPDFNGVQSINTSWVSISDELLKPFLLDGQNFEAGADNSIPVVAPYTAAEEILGLKKLPDNASSKQKLERLKEVRSRAAGYNFEICIRNNSSNQRLELVKSQKNEALQNKDKKDYRAPALQFDYPKNACEDIVVTKDTRTADEKKTDAAWEAFDRKFGKAEPTANKVKLRIVGINNDVETNFSFSASTIISSVLQSSLGPGWFSPDKAVKANETTAKIFPENSLGGDFRAAKTLYTEFSSSAQLKKFVDEQNCIPDFSNSVNINSFDPAENCKKAGQSSFYIASFGSNSAAIDEFERIFSRVLLITALVISVIASFVMMGNIGRIIADSRRETAVFRAIGAKRIDISQIYLTYTAMIAVLIAGISFLIGAAFTAILHSRYSKEATLDALLAYNQKDLSKTFDLFGLNLTDISLICGLILLASLLAAAIALLGNIRRNPIKDMRDER